MKNPFRYFNSSPEVIRLTVMMYIRSPRSAVDSGDYSELSNMTGLKTFVTEFAGHVAAEAARG